MTKYESTVAHTYLRPELAAAVRRVNAKHRAAGCPDLAGLDRSWSKLVRDLRRAQAVGDGQGQRNAIQAWEADATQTIKRST